MTSRVVVVACLLVSPLGTSTAMAGPTPPTAQREIVAYFGRTYLPSWLPPGYIFTRWDTQAGSASAYGTFLVVHYADHGQILEWTVGDARDPMEYGYSACSTHPYAASYYSVGGRRVIYQSGNQGDTAAICVGPSGVQTAVVVWNGHELSPAVMAKIAGGARLVGS
jgi:hypothetical protein